MNISCMESVCRTLFENIGRSRKKDNTKVYVSHSHLNDNTNFHFPKPETVFEMELPTLGKNCMRADCNVLDFLPIKCQYCGDFFCSKHFLPSDHDCKCYDSTFRPAGKKKNRKHFRIYSYNFRNESCNFSSIWVSWSCFKIQRFTPLALSIIGSIHTDPDFKFHGRFQSSKRIGI